MCEWQLVIEPLRTILWIFAAAGFIYLLEHFSNN